MKVNIFITVPQSFDTAESVNIETVCLLSCSQNPAVAAKYQQSSPMQPAADKMLSTSGAVILRAKCCQKFL